MLRSDGIVRATYQGDLKEAASIFATNPRPRGDRSRVCAAGGAGSVKSRCAPESLSVQTDVGRLD
jgi:hypothetical protein